MPWRSAVGWVLGVAAGAWGCQSPPRLTEADCALIKDRIEGAWSRDAVAAMQMAETHKFRRFVLDEQRRLGAAWMGDCQQMIGQPIRAQELICLKAAETIDDVYACSR